MWVTCACRVAASKAAEPVELADWDSAVDLDLDLVPAAVAIGLADLVDLAADPSVVPL